MLVYYNLLQSRAYISVDRIKININKIIMSQFLRNSVIFFLILSTVTVFVHGKSKKNYPPHCTQITKDTDYTSQFKFDYPVAYIAPGQHEAYQPMYCLNPPAVNKAVTTVCDWAAPPQVQFTLGDEYVHVVRIDPTGRFLGNAVMTTYQLCTHNKIPRHISNQTDAVYVLSIDN